MAKTKRKTSEVQDKRARGIISAFLSIFTDNRFPKLLGLVLLLVALYLFIAFTSYLYTWKADQDTVIRMSWTLLFDITIDMENALGRLGAVVSHHFFYWWFGVASYAFVYLCASSGWLLLIDKPIEQFYRRVFKLMLVVFFLAMYLEFFFGGGEFPMGGAVGKGLSIWLQSFLGSVGMGILFVFFPLAYFLWWSFNKFDVDNWEDYGHELRIWMNQNAPKQLREALPMSTETATYFATRKKEKAAKKQAQKQTQKRHVLRPEPKIDTIEKPKPTIEIKPNIPKEGKQLKLDYEEELKKTENGTLRPRNKPKSDNNGFEIVQPKGEPKDKINQALAIEEENKRHVEPYDPTLELSSYQSPAPQLLETYDDYKIEINRSELEANKDQIIETLLNHKIEITKIKATIGPTVTLYEIVPAPGVRISKIKNLEDDIALSLSALGIRIIAPIPGRGTIGIEVPNKNKQMVALRDVLTSSKFTDAKMDLPIALGKTISNEVFVADLAKMPHLLIAGATGQGKSVGINVILMSLLYKKHPSQVKLVLIDPKKVELSLYSRIENHFLGYLPGEDEPIVTETNKVIETLNSLCIEMDERYNLLKKAHVRNLREYNQKFVKRRLNPQKGHRFLPYIVLVIDEFADLIMTAGKEVELPIGRLAQLARAIGIHLIIATQRPSVNIITGVIKANFPARIAYKVTSKIDSRTILDGSGAEQLIGRGDMLLSVGGNTVRLQCAFVDTPEVEKVIDFISDQKGYPEPFFLPEYKDTDGELGQSGMKFSDLDDMFTEAALLVVRNQHGSTSMLQRTLKLGYNRAGRIMDQLESVGIVGPSQGSKPREVLIYSEDELVRYLEHLKTS